MYRYRLGEVFVEIPKDQVEEYLTKHEEVLNKEIENINEEIASIKKTLAELKIKLYSKFSSSINLEEE